MLFSIVTVCFNNLDGLKVTHRSVVKQSITDYEMIIVDGNSNDGTKDWLSKLNTENIKWISEPDQGIFDAMNKGIDMASGLYLIFMNSSDEFENVHVLEKISKAIQECKMKPILVYGDSIDSTADGKKLYKNARSFKKNGFGMFTSHQAMLFRTDQDIRYKINYTYTADYAYVSEYLHRAKDEDVLALPFPVCNFKLGGTNETARFKALLQDFQIRRQIIGFSSVFSGILFLMHLMHTLLKRIFPTLIHSIRYKKNHL